MSKTSKTHFEGFYSKYSFKQASLGGKEILYSGNMLHPDDLSNKYDITLKTNPNYKFCIIYQIKL